MRSLSDLDMDDRIREQAGAAVGPKWKQIEVRNTVGSCVCVAGVARIGRRSSVCMYNVVFTE